MVIRDENVELVDIINSIYTCYPLIYFMLEDELGHSIFFLVVCTTTKSGDSVKRSIYRKQTWNCQLNNFHSWVTLNGGILFTFYVTECIRYGVLNALKNLHSSEKLWLLLL